MKHFIEILVKDVIRGILDKKSALLLIMTWWRSFPYHEPVYTGWSSVHWNSTGMPLVDPVYTGMPLGDPANTCRAHWNTMEKLCWNCPTLECHWRNIIEIVHTGMPLEKLWLLQPKLEHHWRDCYTHTHSSTKLSSVAPMPVWNDKMTGPQISKWTGLCKFSFYLEFTALQWIPVLLLKHHSVHSFDMNTIIVFFIFGFASHMKSV